MNVAFSLYAKMEATLLFYDGRNDDVVYDRVVRFFSDSQKNELYFLTENSLENNILRLSFHHVENPVVFRIESSNIFIDISTGFIGAGYHKWVIGIIEAFAKRYKLHLHEVEDKKDPTGYYKSKDFNMLSAYFVEMLVAMSDSLLIDSKKGISNFMINFAEDYPIIVKDFFAATPIGYLKKNWFLDVLNYKNSTEHKAKYAREFYVWADEGVNDVFLYKTVMSMIWLYYPFREFITEEERKIYSKILYALEIAYKANNNIEYPFDIWIEIASHLGDDSIRELVIKRKGSIESSSENIGFCHEIGTTELAGGFYIAMPISMIRGRDEESGTVEFYNNDIHSIFQVYLFKNENEDEVMDRVVAHIEKAGDKGRQVKLTLDNFKSKVFEKNIGDDRSLIISIVVKEHLALTAWFTYASNNLEDKADILSYIQNISFIK